jgi:hypothetical protein
MSLLVEHGVLAHAFADMQICRMDKFHVCRSLKTVFPILSS